MSAGVGRGVGVVVNAGVGSGVGIGVAAVTGLGSVASVMAGAAVGSADVGLEMDEMFGVVAGAFPPQAANRTVRREITNIDQYFRMFTPPSMS